MDQANLTPPILRPCPHPRPHPQQVYAARPFAPPPREPSWSAPRVPVPGSPAELPVQGMYPRQMQPWRPRERRREVACGNGCPLPLRFLQAANNLNQASLRDPPPVQKLRAGEMLRGSSTAGPVHRPPQLHCSAGSLRAGLPIFFLWGQGAGNDNVPLLPYPPRLPTLPASVPPSMLHPSLGRYNTVPALQCVRQVQAYVAISYRAPPALGTGMNSDLGCIYPGPPSISCTTGDQKETSYSFRLPGR